MIGTCFIIEHICVHDSSEDYDHECVVFRTIMTSARLQTVAYDM